LLRTSTEVPGWTWWVTDVVEEEVAEIIGSWGLEVEGLSVGEFGEGAVGAVDTMDLPSQPHSSRWPDGGCSEPLATVGHVVIRIKAFARNSSDFTRRQHEQQTEDTRMSLRVLVTRTPGDPAGRCGPS
jgi:hypothetical protein